MNAPFPYKIYSCGDHAITVDFGNVIDEAINIYVLQLFHQSKQKNIPGVIDVIPAYSSLTLVYDIVTISKNASATTAYNWVAQQLEIILQEKKEQVPGTGKIIQIPACYEDAYAPDLQEMAQQKNMQPSDIIRLHCCKQYRVYMLGFLPGFAYMGTVESSISMPRRATPRIKVPEGSIGIAGLQTGIYPMESPGGWNLIAQTPLKLFDVTKAVPVLLQAGDSVQFYPINADEFKQLKSAP